MNKEESIVRDGKDRVKRYTNAVESLRRAKSEVYSVECELTNATNELGRWLAPKDMAVDERIGVWADGYFFQCEKIAIGGLGDYKITMRKRD